ncbi:hypothetical protein PTSG_06347 [Salpingoeca rosetta]|uniref:BZIP domain-containing protein n=1 Tax=Salpingoeca rosetta (strain ATCC 50818 / BSB-021) TaxID=946362 RepID=F2UCN0_SALR5|nr:uncharacterized protein PTSG_06347 [Salpingoeca rosetta]EGD74337.1 hypothetical protein PTSG_06347 [Salpingoeca rosetta]|eukprot:XP_004993237.1 hypothetical protein PTSG_06347 [Salpingoeca rosetta]
MMATLLPNAAASRHHQRGAHGRGTASRITSVAIAAAVAVLALCTLLAPAPVAGRPLTVNTNVAAAISDNFNTVHVHAPTDDHAASSRDGIARRSADDDDDGAFMFAGATQGDDDDDGAASWYRSDYFQVLFPVPNPSELVETNTQKTNIVSEIIHYANTFNTSVHYWALSDYFVSTFKDGGTEGILCYLIFNTTSDLLALVDVAEMHGIVVHFRGVPVNGQPIPEGMQNRDCEVRGDCGSGSSPVVIIVGAVVGCIALVALVVVGGFFFPSRDAGKEVVQRDDDDDDDTQQPALQLQQFQQQTPKDVGITAIHQFVLQNDVGGLEDHVERMYSEDMYDVRELVPGLAPTGPSDGTTYIPPAATAATSTTGSSFTVGDGMMDNAMMGMDVSQGGEHKGATRHSPSYPSSSASSHVTGMAVSPDSQLSEAHGSDTTASTMSFHQHRKYHQQQQLQLQQHQYMDTSSQHPPSSHGTQASSPQHSFADSASTHAHAHVHAQDVEVPVTPEHIRLHREQQQQQHATREVNFGLPPFEQPVGVDDVVSDEAVFALPSAPFTPFPISDDVLGTRQHYVFPDEQQQQQQHQHQHQQQSCAPVPTTMNMAALRQMQQHHVQQYQQQQQQQQPQQQQPQMHTQQQMEVQQPPAHGEGAQLPQATDTCPVQPTLCENRAVVPAVKEEETVTAEKETPLKGVSVQSVVRGQAFDKFSSHARATRASISFAQSPQGIRMRTPQQLKELNQADGTGMTPIAYAVLFQYVTILRSLVAHGADVNKKVKTCHTPLHLATMQQGCNHAIVAILLDNGADPNAFDDSHTTPLVYACRNQDHSLVQLLLQHHADVTLADRRGMTPLMHAAARGNLPLTTAILQANQDTITAQDNSNWTALHWAAAVSAVDCMRALLQSQRVSVLALNSAGESPLHLAAKRDAREIVDLLVQRISEQDAINALKARTHAGQTCEELAESCGQLGMAEYLADLLFRLTNSDASTTATSEDGENQAPKRVKRVKSTSQMTPEERKKREERREARRAYMQKRRKDEREELDKLETRVSELEEENKSLDAAREQLRRDAQELRALADTNAHQQQHMF